VVTRAIARVLWLIAMWLRGMFKVISRIFLSVVAGCYAVARVFLMIARKLLSGY